MSIVDRHIDTAQNAKGLSPYVLNVPAQWVGFPKASASNAVVTKTQQTAGSSVAAGTQPDYARNLNVVITPTASSAGVTGGGVTVYGKDVFGSTRSETFNSLAASAAAGQNGSVNFASIDTISMQLAFLAATSSAASAFAVVVGVGQQLGLPIKLRETDAVYDVYQGTARRSWWAATSLSSGNEWTVVTGDYWNGGIKMSAVYNSASLHQIHYLHRGMSAPRPEDG
jgi:hypothetical protein